MAPFGDLRGRDRTLCLFYGLSAVGGFLVMGAMAAAYVADHLADGPAGVVRDFLRDAVANLASGFVYADLTLVWIGLAGFMVAESRRLGIRHVWAYVAGAPVLALCVSLAVFMFVRQVRIAAAADPGRRPPVRLPVR